MDAIRGIVALLPALLLAGCTIARVEPSQRNAVAVTSSAFEKSVSGATIRVRSGQVLAPLRADGVEEFCTIAPVFFFGPGAMRPMHLCFRDDTGAGRFTRAFTVREDRSAGVAVDIPYTVREFPCGNCQPANIDLTYVTDPAALAEQSIAPAPMRPLVQAALASPAPLDAGSSAAQLAAAEVRDRRAIWICSSQNPGSAGAMFGVVGALGALAGGFSERSCIGDYMRTGAMPPTPPPLPEVVRMD